MKRHWKQILLAVSSAAVSTVVAALTRRDHPTDSSSAAEPTSSVGANVSAKADPGLRGSAINFLSDVMAETYRKIRTEQGEKRR